MTTSIINGVNVKNPAPVKETKGVMDFLFRSISFQAPKEGDLMEGKVLSKRGQSCFVDLGPFGTGIIYGKEFLIARDVIKKLNPGDSITCKVADLNNEDGYIELSLKDARQEIVWKEARELLENHTPIELAVTGANKGGLVMDWKGIQGFLPTSQLRANHYPRIDGGDRDKILSELKKLVGTKLTVNIITASHREEKLIFSEKYTESAELRGIVAKYKVGDVVEGVVTGVVDFGIFIKLEEGLEGLAHISELDWSLVEKPSDLFKSGDAVKAKVIGVENGKVSLSVKALTPDPWLAVKDKYEKGDIIEGEVIKFNQYGALICLTKGVCGLVHISEFGSDKEMQAKLAMGKKYPFQINIFEPDSHRMTLNFLKESIEGGAPASKAEAVETATPAVEVPQETLPKAENTDSSQLG